MKLRAQCLAHRKGSINSDNNTITVLSGFKDGLPDLPVPCVFLLSSPSSSRHDFKFPQAPFGCSVTRQLWHKGRRWARRL